MAYYDEPGTDETASLTGGYAPPAPNPGYQAPAAPAAASPTNFFSDPSLKLLEDQVRKRMTAVATPLQSNLPGMADFQTLLAQFGGGANGGATAAGAGDPLAAFRQFAAGFNPTAVTDQLAAYGANRPNTAASDLQAGLAALGPNTALSNLQGYTAGRDANAPVGTLQSFLAGLNPLGDYENRLATRVSELHQDPFTETQLAARRAGALGDIEDDRAAALETEKANLSARGLDASSGVLDRANREVNRRFDRSRSSTQNMLVQEEFKIAEERKARADAMEAQGALLRLQSKQLAAGIVGQIAQMQQQGISMNDALQTTVAQLGLADRAQQQSVLTTVAQLTQQGTQMEDALQIALTQAGIQAQGQAASLQSELGGMDVAMRGQDLDLQATLANANVAGRNGSLGALMQYLGMQEDLTKYNDERSASSVTLASLLDTLARQGLMDVQGGLPQLR